MIVWDMKPQLGTVWAIKLTNYFTLLLQNHYFDIQCLKINVERDNKGTPPPSIIPFKI